MIRPDEPCLCGTGFTCLAPHCYETSCGYQEPHKHGFACDKTCPCHDRCYGCGGDPNVGAHGMTEYGGCV